MLLAPQAKRDDARVIPKHGLPRPAWFCLLALDGLKHEADAPGVGDDLACLAELRLAQLDRRRRQASLVAAHQALLGVELLDGAPSDEAVHHIREALGHVLAPC